MTCYWICFSGFHTSLRQTVESWGQARAFAPDAVPPRVGHDDAFVLLHPEGGAGSRILRELRSSPATALAPILPLRSDRDVESEQDQWLADALLDPVDGPGGIEALRPRLDTLASRVAALPALPCELLPREAREITFLRYMLTRQFDRVEPVRHATAAKGYNLPLAALILGYTSGEELIALEELSGLGLLRGTFQDRIHLCPQCGHYAINFREVCPTCRSPHLTIMENVHHFRCGHSAPENDFREGEHLICPKCRRRLRHLGVDHDRPNQVALCRACSAYATEPAVECLSLPCGQVFPPDRSLKLDIRAYSLTLQGAAAAERGQLPPRTLTDILQETFHTVGSDAFRELTRVAQGLAERYNRPYVLMRFEIVNYGQLLEEHGAAECLEILKNLVEVLKGIFRDTDPFWPEGEAAFQVLFLETTRAGMETACQRALREVAARLATRVDLHVERIEGHG